MVLNRSLALGNFEAFVFPGLRVCSVLKEVGATPAGDVDRCRIEIFRYEAFITQPISQPTCNYQPRVRCMPPG